VGAAAIAPLRSLVSSFSTIPERRTIARHSSAPGSTQQAAAHSSHQASVSLRNFSIRSGSVASGFSQLQTRYSVSPARSRSCSRTAAPST
jgi:hypothetical protein